MNRKKPAPCGNRTLNLSLPISLSRSRLTLFVPENDAATKIRVDFVSEVASASGISLGRFDPILGLARP